MTSPEAVMLRATLRSAGLRVTLPRVSVLWALRRAGAPVSHGDVSRVLSGHALDRATVYRNLLDLVRAGLARRTDLGDHVWRFEAVPHQGGRRNPDRREHPHFVCNQCGTVECLDNLSLHLGRSARAPRALRTKAVEILVKGRCDRCD